MASAGLKERLVEQIDGAYALERSGLRWLERMIETSGEPGLRDALRRHRLLTDRQVERLRQRLEAHSARPSVLKQGAARAGAVLKGALARVRGDEESRDARAAYASTQFEIASYRLLERLAERAGDEETAEVARQNRWDEEELARSLEAHWDALAERSRQ
ncbi:MAG TPA: DUF892 family protein [Gaiellaceae bacterium]